jgi:hypothetical protein
MHQYGYVDTIHCCNDPCLCLKARIIAASMLTCVWQELEYHINVCCITRGARIELL